MDEAETDVLAYMTFPPQHRAKLHSTNPLERLNGEIKRRTEVVGIFPNEAAITRLVGAILLEQNDEWAVQRSRYITLETIASIPPMIPSSACHPWQADQPGQCRSSWWPSPATPRRGTRPSSRGTRIVPHASVPKPRGVEEPNRILMRQRLIRVVELPWTRRSNQQCFQGFNSHR
jgi:hypothetical protein